MRRPRDYDSELKALQDKAGELHRRKLVQLGELVVATRADALPIEELAGALLAAIETRDVAVRKAWRERGAIFFRAASKSVGGAATGDRSNAARESGGASPRGEDRA
ncbi:conjugal transfer protein TraD [Sphingomonas sp. MMS24-J13]|uniref:conjugal transfer protein TraD n=1 Tax=Sphingomonas sp. MMS24-J13 TaxID=3238686 RepID=UPI00384B4322